MITQNEILQAAATIASGIYAKGYKGTQMCDVVDISTRCAYRMAQILEQCNNVGADEQIKAHTAGPQNR